MFNVVSVIFRTHMQKRLPKNVAFEITIPPKIQQPPKHGWDSGNVRSRPR
jgi:hypothetical protein